MWFLFWNDKKGDNQVKKWLTFLLRYKEICSNSRFSHWRTQKASTCFSWKPVFAPLEHQTGRVTGWGCIRSVPFDFTLQRFYASVAAVWCRAEPWFLSDFSIFNNNLGNQEVKSHPTVQIGKQGHVVIACHSSMVVCCRWFYDTQTR